MIKHVRELEANENFEQSCFGVGISSKKEERIHYEPNLEPIKRDSFWRNYDAMILILNRKLIPVCEGHLYESE